MDRRLKQLRQSSANFSAALQDLENGQECQGLSLYSFLMLPMQRVTRLPLLCSALVSHLPSNHPQLSKVKEALAALTSLASECNEAARKEEREEELAQLARNLEWRDVEPLPMVSSGRWLLRTSHCNRVTCKDSPEKLTFGRQSAKRQGFSLILLSDWLIVCKKKGDSKLAVVDHCPRNLIQICPVETSGVPGVNPDLSIWLSLLQNTEHKTVEMLLTMPTSAERSWWINTPHHSPSDNGEDFDYEAWDQPRVEIIATRKAEEEGELSVNVGQQADVLRKKANGWLFISTSKGKGWIPQSVTNEIESDHRRARNFRQRYQFLKALADPSL